MKDISTVRLEVESFYRKNSGEWFKEMISQNKNDPSSFPLRLYLEPPVKDAEVKGSKEDFRRFCEEWKQKFAAGHVDFLEKDVPGMGKVEVPIHLVFNSVEEVSAWAGKLIEFRCSKKRMHVIYDRIPSLFESALKLIGTISNLSDTDFECLIGVSKWILQHKNSEPVLIRQLPVRGVDTRWFEINRPLLLDFLQEELNLDPVRKDLRQFSLMPPPPMLTVVLLDHVLKNKSGGLSIIASTTEDLGLLQIKPHKVIFIDDLDTAISLHNTPGAVAVVLDRRYIAEYAKIGWIAGAGKTQYLGNIDTQSFAILHNLRVFFPAIQNLTLNDQIFNLYKDIWTFDDDKPLEYLPDNLTADEARMCLAMQEGYYGEGARMDLQRIPLADVVSLINGQYIKPQETPAHPGITQSTLPHHDHISDSGENAHTAAPATEMPKTPEAMPASGTAPAADTASTASGDTAAPAAPAPAAAGTAGDTSATQNTGAP